MALTIETIQEMHKEIDRKRDSEITAAKTRANKAHKSLDEFWETFNGGEGDSAITSVSNTNTDYEVKKKELDTIIDKGLKHIYPTEMWVSEIIRSKGLDEIITQPIIYDELCREHPEITRRPAKSVRGQIAGLLKKMLLKERIYVFKPSFGQNPTEFKRSRNLTDMVNDMTNTKGGK